jgi:hypothetical protein
MDQLDLVVQEEQHPLLELVVQQAEMVESVAKEQTVMDMAQTPRPLEHLVHQAQVSKVLEDGLAYLEIIITGLLKVQMVQGVQKLDLHLA